MATCKDCFHKNACGNFREFLMGGLVEKTCKHFKNKADVVPVVRCIDCKHLMFSDCYGECSIGYMGIVSPNDYCSYGERKEE